MTTRSSEAEPNGTSLAVADDSKNNNSTTFLVAKATKLLRKWKRKSSPSSSSSSVNSPCCDDQLLEMSLGLNVKRHNLSDDQLLEMSLGGNKKLWEMHWSGLEEKIMKEFGNDKTGNNLTILSSAHSSCSVNLPFPAESNNDRYGDFDTRALQLQMEVDNPKVVSEVLNLGNANLNLRNTREYTVLHVADRRKDPSVIVRSLSKGACVSDSTLDGRTSITICWRLTRPKDYDESTKQGQETNKDRVCIDVLEREILRNPMAGNISMSSMMVDNDLLTRLPLLEIRVAFARLLFPLEAMAMEIVYGLPASKASCGNLREFDLNEIPYELQALQKTVETGPRFFPNCSEVLDRFLENYMQETLLLVQSVKKTRLMELKAEVMKAFDKDKAENNWVSFPSSSACSNSSKASVNHKVRKRQLY